MNIKKLLPILLFCAISPVSAESGWSHWRGPNADGTSSDATPPLKWSADDQIKWKTAIPGRGSSTPIVHGQNIFIVSAIKTGDPAPEKAAPAPARPQPAPDRRRRRGNGGGGAAPEAAPIAKHQFVVMCINRADGKVRWQKSVNELVPHSGSHADHGYASASPITDGKHVWAHFGSRGTFCLTVDGDLVWSRTDLGKMTTRGEFGDGSSPTLHGDHLVIPWDHEGDSYIAALNKDTGKTIWKTDRDHPTSWTTPLIVEHGDSVQVIQSGQDSAVSYDLKTGKEIWRADGQTQRPVATPVAADGIAYIGSGFRGSFLAAYQLEGAEGNITDSKRQLWSVGSGTPDIASFLLTNGRLYYHSGKDGILTCMDVKTGKPHYSRERIEGMSRVYASPVAANGHVYLTDRDGTTVVLKDGPKLEIVATNELGEGVDATPALVGKQVFIRGAKHLYCVE